MTRPRTFTKIALGPLPRGYHSKFVRWAKAYGSYQLARSLETDHRVVMTWLSPDKPVRPRQGAVDMIMGLSKDFPLGIGPLDLKDILGVREVSERTEHPIRRSMTDPRFIPTRVASLRQADLIRSVKEIQRETGQYPTYEELSVRMRLTLSTVRDLVLSLEMKGYLVGPNGKHRGIRILPGSSQIQTRRAL